MKSCLLFLWLLSLPLTVAAQSIINCHCFQERTFNPNHPAAADPYFLATTQNSFMAQSFGLKKRSLVKAKMEGADANDLWILYELAKRSSLEPSRLEQAYRQQKSWPRVVEVLNVDPERVGGTFWKRLGSPTQLAQHIVDAKLSAAGVAAEVVSRARRAGMANQELILAVLVGDDPVSLFSLVKTGHQSWGKYLAAQGLYDGDAIARQVNVRFFQ